MATADSKSPSPVKRIDNRGAAAALAIGCSGGWAMALHALATLTPTGVAALVLPLGALYRQGREQALRMALLEQDLIDGVIAVPRGLLPQESGPAAVLLLRRLVPDSRAPRWLRLATRQLAARPAFAVLQVSALAVGLLALVLLVLLRTDLISSWRRATPPDAPNRFVINIQPEQGEAAPAYSSGPWQPLRSKGT